MSMVHLDSWCPCSQRSGWTTISISIIALIIVFSQCVLCAFDAASPRQPPHESIDAQDTCLQWQHTMCPTSVFTASGRIPSCLIAIAQSPLIFVCNYLSETAASLSLFLLATSPPTSYNSAECAHKLTTNINIFSSSRGSLNLPVHQTPQKFIFSRPKCAPRVSVFRDTYVQIVILKAVAALLEALCSSFISGSQACLVLIVIVRQSHV
jgi:hypothetical protein